VRVLLSGMDRVQFSVAQLPQMTLAGQVFSFAVARVAPIQPTTGPEAFATDVALDTPICEKINDTLGLLLTLKTITH
jgi:hypothetical protein